PFGYAALLLAHLPVEIRLLALGAELETALLTVVCSGVVGTALGMLAARLSRAPADEPAGTAAPLANGQNEAPAGAEAAPAAETPADAQTNAPDAPSDDSEAPADASAQTKETAPSEGGRADAPAAEETAEKTAPAADGKGGKEA
ncbi:MAG: hypothetical protein J6125_00800, partial [Clostridia bacterium]|nr:hypothetical protein [Clostridia bacterium]